MKRFHPRQLPFLLLAFVLPLAAGCSPKESTDSVEETGNGKPLVFASNYPLAFFAETIGQEAVEVLLPDTDGDPAFWQPDRQDLERLQAADSLLMNGAGYEQWLGTVSLPEDRMVQTSAGFQNQLILEEGAITHQHGPEGAHTHGETAFTTWLNLQFAIQQAEAVNQALAKLLPDRAGDFNGRLEKLKADLESLDLEMQQLGSKLGSTPLLASHPVYQYLAGRYELNIQSLHWEPDTPLSESHLEELQVLLQDHSARWILWEGSPIPESVERLKQQGIQSIVFNPCGNRPTEGNFLSVMRNNLRSLSTITAANGGESSSPPN